MLESGSHLGLEILWAFPFCSIRPNGVRRASFEAEVGGWHWSIPSDRPSTRLQRESDQGLGDDDCFAILPYQVLQKSMELDLALGHVDEDRTHQRTIWSPDRPGGA